MVLCIQQSTAVRSATRCSSIIESALQTSSHVYTMQHKRMRQAIGCRSVPQLQTLWVNMIYIFVIYTNICVYNVFVYGGQWPHVLCIFTLYISIRSSIMFLYMVGSGPIFCAFLLCTFLFVHYGRQVHPVPVCSVHVYSVYFYYLCFCHVCFYSGQKRLSAPQGSKKACLPGDGVYRAAERAAERRSSSCRLKACLPGDGV